MKFFQKQNGASQTEYIIIVVLIAVSTMAAVGKYGNEIKSLFQKSTAKLSLYENNSEGNEEEVSPDYGGELSGDDSIISDEADSEDDSDVFDDNNIKSDEECQAEFNNLMNEKTKREHQHNAIIHASIRRENYYRNLKKKYANKVAWFNRRIASGCIKIGIYDPVFGFYPYQLRPPSYYRDFYLAQSQKYSRYADREVERREQEYENYNEFLEEWNKKMEQWQQECGSRH